jgi:PKD repeat protein
MLMVVDLLLFFCFIIEDLSVGGYMPILKQISPHTVELLINGVDCSLTTLRRLTSCKQTFSTFTRGVLSFVFFAVLVFFAPAFCFANFGAEWNPTGNPIGGGPGYSDSVRHQDADYYVTDKASLLSALSSASSGDLIYVADTSEINLSSETASILIPGGVILASGRGRTLDDTISWGGLIYTNRHDTQLLPLIRTYGYGVRITGLRLRGADPDIGQLCSPTVYEKMCAVSIYNGGCEVDNCEIYEWGYAGVVAGDGAHNAYVHHNYIHHNRRRGCGYGVVTGDDADVLIEANLFDFYRHAVAASPETTNCYEARYNISLEHDVYWQCFDRHGTGGSPNYGGKRTLIHHNTFWHDDNKGVGINGIPCDTAEICNNWFYHTDSMSAIQLYSNIHCGVYDNHFGDTPPPGVAGKLPIAVANTNIDSGTAPLSVSFTSTGSNDPDGSIAWYEWDFGDDSSNLRRISGYHTFDSIGSYNVVLTAFDNDGIPDRDMIPVVVLPTTADSHYLSFWVKDSYRSNAYPDYFYMQVFVDNNLVWQQDVVGDSSWMHIIRNVTTQVAGKDSVTIQLRLCCNHDVNNQQYIELYTYWDDVTLFWSNVRNGDFEAPNQGTNQSPAYWTAGHSSQAGGYWGWETRSGQVRSGSGAWMMRMTEYGINRAGDYVYVQQRVAINSTGIVPSGGGSKVGSLYVPYPNPAALRTQFGYKLHTQSEVLLNVYDISGRFINNLVEKVQAPGEYDVIWDGKNAAGMDVANGVYFFRLSAGNFEETKQIVWLR